MVTLAVLALVVLVAAGFLAFMLGHSRSRGRAATRAAQAAQRGHEAAAKARASGRTPEQIVRDNDGAW